MEFIADSIVLDLIMQDKLNLPYVLFGHSLGAPICFEVARRIEAMSQPLPQHVYVSASGAPQNRKGITMDVSDESLIADMRKFGGTPELVFENPELLKMVLGVMRADYMLLNTYQFDHSLSPLVAPLTALYGSEDGPRFDAMKDWQAVSAPLSAPVPNAATAIDRVKLLEGAATAVECHRLRADGDSSAETNGGLNTGVDEEGKVVLTGLPIRNFYVRQFSGGHFYLHDHCQLLVDIVSAPISQD